MAGNTLALPVEPTRQGTKLPGVTSAPFGVILRLVAEADVEGAVVVRREAAPQPLRIHDDGRAFSRNDLEARLPVVAFLPPASGRKLALPGSSDKAVSPFSRMVDVSQLGLVGIDFDLLATGRLPSAVRNVRLPPPGQRSCHCRSSEEQQSKGGSPDHHADTQSRGLRQTYALPLGGLDG